MSEASELENLLSRILEAVPAGIVHVGPDGAIHRANDDAQAFLGLSFDALASRYTVDFAGHTYFEDGSPCPVEDYPVTRCLVTGTPQGPTTIGVEQPSGDVRWAIFTAVPVEQDEGRGAVVTLVDITERMAAERERLALERRLQLSDRLVTMGTLAAGVAHEINNPLTYVIGNLDLAQQMLADPPHVEPEVLELLGEATTGADRVARIVADLGRFSRISEESGAVEPAAALDAAAAMAAPELRHRARLVSRLEGLPAVQAIEGKLVQVLLNLLVNAAHAIPAGRVDAHAVTVTGSTVGEVVVIEVHDTGTGMSDEVRAQAFDPFFSTKDDDGTGLGLAISRSLVEEMGGALRLGTRSEAGTTVRLELPRAEVVATPASPGRTPTPGPAERRLSILVVDDEPGIRRLVAELLSGHQLATAASGREALQHLETRRFDVVLCDVTMPDLTGADVHREVHGRDPELARRIVFMTGGAFTAETRRYLEDSRQPVLHKPFDVAALRRAVRRAAAAS